MKILVTGADGFLGSHVVEAARAAGHTVTETALYVPQGHTGFASAGAHRGDIGDPVFMRPLVEAADAVINCAAWISVPYGQVMPAAYRSNNADAVHMLLQLKPRRFIQISTSEVFDGRGAPYTSESLPNPITEYGASKAAAEMYCRAHKQATVVRLFNLFGPRQTPRAVHALFIREALRVKRGDKPLADLDGPHGSRAFLFAPWAAAQILRAIEDTRPLVQLASPEPVEIADLWPMVARAVGIDANLVRWDGSKGGREVAKLYGYSSPGYESPAYNLKGLLATAAWYEAQEVLPFAEANYQ